MLSKHIQKKLDGNCTRMLQAILNKSWKPHHTKQQLYDYQPPISKILQIRRTRHAGHCWKNKDELISDVHLRTTSHGRASVWWPARTYLQQLRTDTGCSLEDLPAAMDDRGRMQREREREREREKERERERERENLGNPWKQQDFMMMMMIIIIAGLNSETSFSKSGYWIKTKESSVLYNLPVAVERRGTQAFLEGMSVKCNTNSFIQGLNFDHLVRFIRQ